VPDGQWFPCPRPDIVSILRIYAKHKTIVVYSKWRVWPCRLWNDSARLTPEPKNGNANKIFLQSIKDIQSLTFLG